jgi:hypothetical protein
MSRRSLALAGGVTFVLGVMCMAGGFGLLWITQSAFLVAVALVLVAVIATALWDALKP